MRWSEEDLSQALSENPALKIRESKAPEKQGETTQLCREDFDSQAEYRYYQRYILPGVLTGIISSVEIHKSFELVEAFAYCGQKYQNRVYTPDFVVTYSDGTVEIIEIKNQQVKKNQRDYPLRRQLFLWKYCIPNGWKFCERRAEEL